MTTNTSSSAGNNNHPVVRSLRRRLWHALQKEDAETAMRAYTCTRADYQVWLAEEAAEQESHRHEKEKKRGSMKKMASLVNRSRRRKSENHAQAPLFISENDDDVPLLQTYMDPSLVFLPNDVRNLNDPFDTSPEIPQASKLIRRKSMRPRLAGLFQKSESQEDVELENDQSTTPLHQAARLGSAALVRLFLEHGGNPNVKNGKQRTALHMAAGGLSAEEESLLQALYALRGDTVEDILGDDVGIRSVELEEEEDNHPIAGAKKAATAMAKFFRHSMQAGPSDVEKKSNHEKRTVTLDKSLLNTLTTERMDAVLAILSWCHTDGEGPSINSVDVAGRTALHYAAELGRADVCMAIVSSFGAMLTIIDDASRTPCELAAQHSHLELAAQLEARALLYSDPYGVDDELMASVLAEERDDSKQRKKLMGPFNWFQTWTKQMVRKERYARINITLKKTKEILQVFYEQEQANEIMFNFNVNDSMDSVPVGDVTESPVLNGTATKDTNVAEAVETGSSADPMSLVQTEGQLGNVESDVAGDGSTVDPTEEQPGSVESQSSHSSASGSSVSESCGSECSCSGSESVVSESSESAGEVAELAADAVTSPDQHDAVAENEEAANNDADAPAIILAKDPTARRETSEYNRLQRSIEHAHVEKFLIFYRWDMELATKQFRSDPILALREAGVVVTTGSNEKKTGTHQTCLICFEEFDSKDDAKWKDLQGCQHGFCIECLREYIADCARSKATGMCIPCPHHECDAFLTRDEVNSLVTLELRDSLLDAAEENFVVTARDLKFCPYPGCEGVVKYSSPTILSNKGELGHDLVNIGGAVCTAHPQCGEKETMVKDESTPLTYEGVPDARYTMTRGATQPRKAHRFCFCCGSTTIHWPVTCEMLERWKDKVRDEIGGLEDEKDGDGEETYEETAQRLWIKANTRPCPQCNANIEKNEGCNHMTCTNRHCRHEFCWICRKDWKLHNTETGGFFRCNRWQEDEDHDLYNENYKPSTSNEESDSVDDDVDSDDEEHAGYGTAVYATRIQYMKQKKMNRFLHHYRRWNAHSESAALERKMADSVCERLAPVVEAAIEFNGFSEFSFSGRGLSFVHAAFTELLECRSMLQHSYAFAFFRYPTLYFPRRNRLIKTREQEKATFEQSQSELEMMTEQLSDIVARMHLRASQTQIMFMTKEAAEKRIEFCSIMIGLLESEREDAEREKQEKEKQGAAAPSDPTAPSDVGDLIERLQSHRTMDGDNFRYEPDSDDEQEDAQMQQALQASLQDFLAGETVQGDVADSAMDDQLVGAPELHATLEEFVAMAEAQDGPSGEFSCRACTFMNTRGARCAMCGTPRDGTVE